MNRLRSNQPALLRQPPQPPPPPWQVPPCHSHWPLRDPTSPCELPPGAACCSTPFAGARPLAASVPRAAASNRFPLSAACREGLVSLQGVCSAAFPAPRLHVVARPPLVASSPLSLSFSPASLPFAFAWPPLASASSPPSAFFSPPPALFSSPAASSSSHPLGRASSGRSPPPSAASLPRPFSRPPAAPAVSFGKGSRRTPTRSEDSLLLLQVEVQLIRRIPTLAL
mmetsp:Transcript_22839/g.63839  ORF Transcript_22839/g.63839 Transcript_22839/m.63839 type:complete len:226 (+) Transcript_22839:960-1637(+)